MKFKSQEHGEQEALSMQRQVERRPMGDRTTYQFVGNAGIASDPSNLFKSN
ncbi:MAG: hypothetical protein ACK521_02350 [bacterium]